MNTTTRTLFDSALHLPESERAELAASLIESLENKFDDEVDVAWGLEIGQRTAELDSGEVSGVPWDKARKMILGLSDGSATD
ncbi:MAG: addiction module protein [Planctomycetota bacterium]|nr:addiction module protein [Planctomycetota bacterium]